MGLFVNQEHTRTKLQERIAADLAEKAKRKAEEDSGDRPDGVEDSAYMENSKHTTSLAGVWLAIVIVGVAVLIWLVVAST